MFSKTASLKSLLVPAAVAALMLASGCDEDEAKKATAAPAAPAVDLSKAEDLFAQPIKPNPLMADPTSVVVRVNGEAITRGDVLKVMGAALQQMAGRVPPEQLQQMQAQMYARVKDQLINQKLMEKAVANAKISVSDSEIQEAINDIGKSLPEGKTLEEALNESGATMDKLKNDIKEQLATRKFLEEKTKDIAPATDEEAKKFYDENPEHFNRPETVTASHILIPVETNATDEAKAGKKAQIEKIRSDIVAGNISFEDAAKQYSSCPSSQQGGSLGTFEKGRMVPEFDMAAFSQDVGVVGDVVQTQFGYHIIKVTDKKEAGVVSFDEAKKSIEDYLTSRKKQQAVADFVKSLRDSATIEVVE